MDLMLKLQVYVLSESSAAAQEFHWPHCEVHSGEHVPHLLLTSMQQLTPLLLQVLSLLHARH